MTNRLAGKVAIVTGTASGIGHAITLEYLRQGALVLAFDRSITTIPNEFDKKTYVCVQGDVTDENAVSRAVDLAAERFGKLDVLCNAAGIGLFGTLEELTLVDLQNVMDVNFYGPFLFMKATIPHLLSSGRGNIVNISSVGATRARPGLSAYAASKAALIALTRGAGIDYAQQNVVANTILPGVVDTAMIQGDQAAVAQAARSTPVGRVGKAEEIAALATFLASDECRYATATEFIADGGRAAT